MTLNLSPQKKILIVAAVLFTVSLSTILFVFRDVALEGTAYLKNELLSAFLPTHETHDEAYFRKTVSNAEDPLIVVQSNGEIVYVSPALEVSLGYESGSWAKELIFTFVHPDDVALLAGAITKTEQLEAKVSAIGPYRLRNRTDNTYRVHMATGTPVKDEIVLTTKDITQSVEQLKKDEKKIPGSKKIRDTKDEQRAVVEKL